MTGPTIEHAVAAAPPATVPALKEWAVVCDLLLAGRQAVLFRKGGIGEKGFWADAPEFYLFPTAFHQNGDKVRPEFERDVEAAASAAPPPGVLLLRGFCRVVEAVEVRHPERIHALRDLHPYTDEQIAMRLEFRPRKPLVLLVVRAYRLAAALAVPMREEFGGCVSWVDVDLAAPTGGTPALPEDDLRALSRRIRAAVG